MSPIEKLEKNCTDYSIHNRDWPRHGFRYEVTAVHFFAHARAVGKTLEQAVDRALTLMEKRYDSMPRVTHEELLQAFVDEDRETDNELI